MEERIIKDVNNLLIQLLQKMREAGYEWNAEKLELKKVEQKPEERESCEHWSDEQTRINLLSFVNTWGKAKLPLTSVNRFVNYLEKRGEQTSAWSVEDEIGLADTMWAVKQARTIAKDENDMGNLWYAERWLKSLKDRYTWKPSDEQMKALLDSVPENVFAISEREMLLDSLYQDLWKLRKE